ncbi:MAG: hypothetical protein ACSLEN_02395 [Candidatus Malihini olakiniferum]
MPFCTNQAFAEPSTISYAKKNIEVVIPKNPAAVLIPLPGL